MSENHGSMSRFFSIDDLNMSQTLGHPNNQKGWFPTKIWGGGFAGSPHSETQLTWWFATILSCLN